MPRPDDRSDNVKKLQAMTRNTIENWHEAQETMSNPDLSQQQKAAIRAKNRRRERAVEAFRSEIRDEYHDQME